MKATEQPTNTSPTAGKAFLNMLGVVAKCETNMRREWQIEGIVRAKANKLYKGRKPVIDTTKVRELRGQSLGAIEIAAKLGIRRASKYRVTGGAASP